MSEEAATSEDNLPVAEVFSNSPGAGDVAVKWGGQGTSAIVSTSYADPPYLFSAFNSNGVEPVIKTFGSLLHCDGGVLTIGGTQYRINVQQLQQQEQVPLAYQPAMEFVKKQMEEHTERRSFSKAGYSFARSLLGERGIYVRANTVNIEHGEGPELPPFSWTVTTQGNESVRTGEHYKTPKAMEWFEENFLTTDSLYGLKVVTGKALPELKGNGKKATGKSDLVIGKKAELQATSDAYDFAFGLVELKQDIYDINKGQNVLELASLATISRVGKNCSVLATDCIKKWELYWFENESTIVRGVYSDGRKCLKAFRALLDAAESRVLGRARKKSRPVLPNFQSIDKLGEQDHASEEQDLAGFDIAEDAKTKALENVVQLNALADHLEYLYGERPAVPSWARVENACPDYYL